MHNFIISVVLNLSVAFPAIIGLTRFRFISSDYYPFIIVICLGLFSELLSIVMVYNTGSNAINSNIFVLLEYGLILFQFYKWNYNSFKKYYVFALLGFTVWCIDNFFINSIIENNSLFRVFYSFVIVFLSIDQLNKIIVNEKNVLFKNAMFAICIGFLFYYTCKAFVEVFNAVHLGLSYNFLWNLWIILYFVNVVSNVIYALAILCIPRKHEFTLPY